MEDLPWEVVLTVRDALAEGLCLAEYVKLGEVCRSWRGWTGRSFGGWLRRQPEGIPLRPFCGSGAELEFVRRHVPGRWLCAVGALDNDLKRAVLVEHKVSVTVAVSGSGTTWWLTRESGRTPMECGDASGMCCSRTKRDSARQQTCALMVIKVVAEDQQGFDSVALLAPLCNGVMVAAKKRVVPVLQGSLWCRWKPELRFRLMETYRAGSGKLHDAHAECVDSIAHGMFSCGAECTCEVLSTLCAGCSAVSSTEWFVKQESYCGLYPQGEDHWWSGVTDAVGQTEAGGACSPPMWLSCRG
jgi:hypothetical protein